MTHTLNRMGLKLLQYTQYTRVKKLVLCSSLIKYPCMFEPTKSQWRMITCAQEYDKATVIYVESAEILNISLKYIDKALKINKLFTFYRKPSEKCFYALEGMGNKINKYAERKAKQKGIEYSETVKLCIESKNGDVVSCSTVSCMDTFTSTDNYLRVGNILYTLDVNPPLLTTLILPENIMAGYFVYPSKLKGFNCNMNEILLTWFRSEQKFESIEEIKNSRCKVKWEKIGEDFNISISDGDISRILKVIGTPYSGDHEGADIDCISSVLVSPGPGICPFEKRHQNTKEILDKNQLRIISYNILANCYTVSDYSRNILYPTTPPYALEFDYRKLLLHKEILGYNADLICLQEVEPHAFENDFQSIYSRCGFEGIFYPKEVSKPEGLATFYRKKKLTLREERCFILWEELENNVLFGDLLEKVKLNETFYKSFIRRKTILQMCVFSKEGCPSEIVVVGSTHLYANPESNHVRLLQAWLCIALLQQTVNQWKSRNQNNVAMILCGDFNSLPSDSVYRLMTSGLVAENDIDWKSKAGEEVEGISLSHSLGLASACAIPEFTTFTVGFNGVLDYIFFEEGKFSVEQVVPFPSHEELTKNGALPSVTFPSDHIALVADLKWLK